MKLRTSLLTILAERSLSLEPRANMLIAHYTNWVSWGSLLQYNPWTQRWPFVVPCVGAQGSVRKMQTVWLLLLLQVIYCLSSLAWFQVTTNISATLGEVNCQFASRVTFQTFTVLDSLGDEGGQETEMPFQKIRVRTSWANPRFKESAEMVVKLLTVIEQLDDNDHSPLSITKGRWSAGGVLETGLKTAA